MAALVCPAQAPFDRIIVRTACGEDPPGPLAQLKVAHNGGGL